MSNQNDARPAVPSVSPRTGSYTDAVVMNPAHSPDAADSDGPYTTPVDDDALEKAAAAATQYSPPKYRRYYDKDAPSRSPGASPLARGAPPPPLTLKPETDDVDTTPSTPPAYQEVDELPTPNFQQDVRHSVIIVRTPIEEEGICPFSGCDGCKDPLTCGYRNQYTRSLLVTFLGSTNEHLVRPEFLAADPTKYSALIAKAQQWDRDSSTLLDGLVMHKVTSSDTLQGLAIKYGTTTAAIRRENKMMGSDVISYRVLRVPTTNKGGSGQIWSPSPGPRALAVIVQVAMIQRLQKAADTSFEEARVLLDLNDNDLDAAEAENKAWLEAESSLRGNKGGAKSAKGVKGGPKPPSTLQEFLFVQSAK